MSRIIFGLLLFLAIFSQATILPTINPWMVMPDLVLVLLFVWGAYCGPREALFWIFVAGISLDVLSLDSLGTNVLALSFVLIFAVVAKQRVFHSTVLVPILLVVVATLAHGIVLGVLRGATPGPFILYQALMHAAIVPFLFPFVTRASREY